MNIPGFEQLLPGSFVGVGYLKAYLRRARELEQLLPGSFVGVGYRQKVLIHGGSGEQLLPVSFVGYVLHSKRAYKI